MTPLLTITSKGEGYTATVYDLGDGSYSFTGDMDNDVDGSDFWRQDPCGQSETTLQFSGKSINSGVVPGIVLPPPIIKAVVPRVLGCRATATWNGKTVDGVVFDVGPTKKLGEGSYAMLKALGAPAFTNGNGGIDEPTVEYRFWPGEPAYVNGVTYVLQKYGA
jgi:hypothetical protein